MIIAHHKVVTMDYKVLNTANGELIDSSASGQPMIYLHGAQNIVPGLENALEGKSAGDALDIIVPPADAYGERNEEGIQQVPLEVFQEMESVEPGMTVMVETEEGPLNLVIIAVDETTVTVDANHPMAGKSLTFSVKIIEVRDASEEEIAHGHGHDPAHPH
jgi:FKBP-type peptidyl-prolyl cis-trans isomerase SlyD